MPAILTSSLLAYTLGLCIVLVARRGVRRLFGATIAYAMWSLPFAMALAVWLPGGHASPVANVPRLRSLIVIVDHAATSIHGSSWMPSMLLPAWMAGTALVLLRLVWLHRRLHRQMRPLPDGMRDRLRRLANATARPQMRLHDAGPAVIWSLRSMLLLPTDFMTRFEAHERALVLEHEYTHVRHGDAWWNLLAEIVTAALWFHPLVWFARPRFRLDQELACDDAVLRRHPRAARSYANTLFQGTGRAGTPVLATWLEEPQLKERLTMIRNLAMRKPWRRVGVPVLAALLAGSALSAQAMHAAIKQDAAYATPPSSVVSFKDRHPPRYPADAIKNHLEGTVVLLVKVGTDGKALKVKAKPGKTDPSLVKSAIDAARQWLYNPATDAKGHAVVAWVKVPVTFSMDGYTAPKK